MPCVWDLPMPSKRLQAHCARAGGSQKKMMGKKALDAARILVKDTGLQGRLTPEEFLREREAKLDLLFPMAELMPGAQNCPAFCALMLALWSAVPGSNP